MTSFWRLLEESTVFQGVITLMLVGTICYLYINGQSVPEELEHLAFGVIGFWFGQKVSLARLKSSRG